MQGLWGFGRKEGSWLLDMGELEEIFLGSSGAIGFKIHLPTSS